MMGLQADSPQNACPPGSTGELTALPQDIAGLRGRKNRNGGGEKVGYGKWEKRRKG